MKLKYSYSLLEAACALSDEDYQAVVTAMSKSDSTAAFSAMLRATTKCNDCPQASNCPEWDGYEEEAELICPQGYSRPPSQNSDDYLPKPRVIPNPNEASDKFIEVCEYLQSALADGELEGTPDKIKRDSLIKFWSTRFPDDRPSSIFPEEPIQVVDSDLQLIISALLEQLKVSGDTQEDIAFNVNKLLGTGFGETKVKKIFSDAKKVLKRRHANLPGNTNK